MALNSKTQLYLNQMQSRVKNNLTGGKQFKTRDEVIDLAIEQLYQSLKSQKLL